MSAEAPVAGMLLVVDAANVVGSVPDGWWRDRPGATARLRDRLRPLATTGLPGLPPPLDVVLVVEGPARKVTGVAQVRVVAAAGSGDDAIVDLVRTAGDRACVVVTADRGLRARVAALGAAVRGPRLLTEPNPPVSERELPHLPDPPVSEREPPDPAPTEPDRADNSAVDREGPGYAADGPDAPERRPRRRDGYDRGRKRP